MRRARWGNTFLSSSCTSASAIWAYACSTATSRGARIACMHSHAAVTRHVGLRLHSAPSRWLHTLQNLFLSSEGSMLQGGLRLSGGPAQQSCLQFLRLEHEIGNCQMQTIESQNCHKICTSTMLGLLLQHLFPGGALWSQDGSCALRSSALVGPGVICSSCQQLPAQCNQPALRLLTDSLVSFQICRRHMQKSSSSKQDEALCRQSRSVVENLECGRKSRKLI